MDKGLIKFLLVIMALVAAAVYYHYNGPQTEYSQTLFGHNAISIEAPNTGLLLDVRKDV